MANSFNYNYLYYGVVTNSLFLFFYFRFMNICYLPITFLESWISYHPAVVLTSILHYICHPSPSHLTYNCIIACQFYFFMCLLCRALWQQITSGKHETWKEGKIRQIMLYLSFLFFIVHCHFLHPVRKQSKIISSQVG